MSLHGMSHNFPPSPMHPTSQLLAEGNSLGFTVIGVVGGQGVGKSTLANKLLGHSEWEREQQQPSNISASHADRTTPPIVPSPAGGLRATHPPHLSTAPLPVQVQPSAFVTRGPSWTAGQLCTKDMANLLVRIHAHRMASHLSQLLLYIATI